MKYLKFFLALIAISLAFLTFSTTIYPFFEIGFSTLSEQYPNSKAYIMVAMVDEAGIPLNFYIVGMDFTAKNILIFNVPPNLTVKGKQLTSIYENVGIHGVTASLGNVLKIKFTDFFLFSLSGAKKFIDTLVQKNLNYHLREYEVSEFQKTYKIDKLISNISEEGPLNMLNLYPLFSTLFKSSIDISKFLRMANFFENKPRVFLGAYPFVNSNGIIKTDITKLQTISIELQNCTLFFKPTSFKFTIVNNSSLEPKVFSYLTWNKWSKKGFRIRIVPTVCSYSLRGRNLVFDLKGEGQKEEVYKILQSVYPDEIFEFVELNNFKNLESYYEIEEFAAVDRYYNLGDTDFLILKGN